MKRCLHTDVKAVQANEHLTVLCRIKTTECGTSYRVTYKMSNSRYICNKNIFWHCNSIPLLLLAFPSSNNNDESVFMHAL